MLSDTHAGQLDVSPFPEILRAQRRRLGQLRDHHWREADTALSNAAHAIHRALSAGTWTPRQLQRPRQLDPGTSHLAAAGATPGWRYGGPASPAIEIAIYPDIIQLAARNLRASDTSHHPAP